MPHIGPKPKQVSESDYLDATDNYRGWCPECQEFTRDNTEPDAEEYDCPECGGNSVMGAKQALLLGYIIF